MYAAAVARPLCFVLMPFGKKADPTGGEPIDFDRVYDAAVRPALDDAGLDAAVEWIDGDAMQAFIVQSQDPAAGTEAAQDTAVRIRIVRFGAPAPAPLAAAAPTPTNAR